MNQFFAGKSVVACLMSMICLQVFAADAPLLQPGKKTIHQRVLTTPNCKLTNKAGDKEGEVQVTFSRFYVYGRKQVGGEEWVEVGPDTTGKKAGWLPASCAVEWKMQMSLAFTNPAGRDPLLFFKDKAGIEKIVDAKDPAKLMAPILSNMKKEGRDPLIVAREPEYAVDIQKQFYLLPILDAEEVRSEASGLDMRLLHVASVSKPSENISKESESASQSRIKGFNAAIVFVIDSTLSMDPYIDRTREAVRKVYDRIEKEKFGDKVKFGLIAFRSNIKAVPALEYLTKTYADPTQIKDGKDFLGKIADLKATKVSSALFVEDSYAGVMEAIQKVDWNQFGGRYIVLITDAGAIDGNDKLTSTGLDASRLAAEAKLRGIGLYVLHLKTPAGVRDHQSAEAQYRELSMNAVVSKSLYYPVDAGNVSVFGQMVDGLADSISSQVKLAEQGEMSVGSAMASTTSSIPVAGSDKTSATLAQDAALLGRAMQLAYLGDVTKTTVPPVFQAWISDRDLVDQKIATTDVRVLMTKSQLSDLSDAVRKIADAANDGLISPKDMFERLQSVAATMGRDPNQLKQDKVTKLSELGLLGEYLEGLPYKSDVLNLDEDGWKSMSVSQQQQFIRRLSTKLKHYQIYNADVDRWISLAKDSDPSSFVFPVPLETLP